jgi:hypothetical protein
VLFKMLRTWAAMVGVLIGSGLTLHLIASAGAADLTVSTPPSSASAFPMKVSENHRYLTDQNGRPYLIAGDSPQTILGRMTTEDAEFYFTNRQSYGVNALWVHVMCRENETCHADGATPDGVVPFFDHDLARPNAAYFDRLDTMLNLAAEHGITFFLTPAETSGWLDALRTAGAEKAFAYGEYLGQRYEHFPNIVWMHGNDFQTWRVPEDDELVLAVARGIASKDHTHLHTTELNYTDSISSDDPRWDAMIQLNGVYTYYPSYAGVLREYDQNNPKPIFLEETNYEFEHGKAGSPLNLRRQEYWATLSGAAGQFYGSLITWTLPSDWKLMLDTPGIAQFASMRRFFAEHDWQDLVPDREHRTVVAGYGIESPPGTGLITKDTYLTAARTADGRLAIAYLPNYREISVDLSQLASPVRARWYDPTNGQYLSLSEMLFPNMGTKKFVPPGKNADGDEDWLLELKAQ